jgi:hypothetical protein
MKRKMAAVPLLACLAACSSAPPAAPPSSPPASPSSPAPASSSPASSPQPADSNPAATFSDGSRVEVTSGGGGPGNVHVTLKITAGRQELQLGNTGAFQIEPLDGSGQDPWSSPETPQFYDPSDLSATEAPPGTLSAGASICIVQTFDDNSDPTQAPDVSSWAVTLGSAGKMTLPAGGGAGPDCNVD